MTHDPIDRMYEDETREGDNSPVALFVPDFDVSFDTIVSDNLNNAAILEALEIQEREPHSELWVETKNGHQCFDNFDLAWEALRADDVDIIGAIWNSDYAKQNTDMISQWQLENALEGYEVIELTCDAWQSDKWLYGSKKRFLTASGAGSFANDNHVRVTNVAAVKDAEMHCVSSSQKARRFPKGCAPRSTYQFTTANRMSK